MKGKDWAVSVILVGIALLCIFSNMGDGDSTETTVPSTRASVAPERKIPIGAALKSYVGLGKKECFALDGTVLCMYDQVHDEIWTEFTPEQCASLPNGCTSPTTKAKLIPLPPLSEREAMKKRQTSSWGSCGAPRVVTVRSGQWSERIRGRRGCYWYFYRSPGSGVGEVRANGKSSMVKEWTSGNCLKFEYANYLQIRLKRGESFEATFKFLPEPPKSACS